MPSPSASRRPAPSPAQTKRMAVFSVTMFLLAAVAATVSFAKGSWLGVVWILLGGLTSNMAWFYVRRMRVLKAREREQAPPQEPGSPASPSQNR